MIWNGYNFDSFRDYLQKKATPIFFSRASIAFDVNGNAVNANVPRYNNGIMVEESTTNLLTANQSNGCEDGTTTGFSGSTGTTLSSSTDWYAGGNASLKAVCDGTASNQGYNLSTRPLAVSGLIYAGQVKIYGLTGDVTVYLNFYDSSSNQLSANSQNITLNGTTQTGVVTGTAPANAASVSLMVRTNGAQSVTFYVDMLQIEQKSYPTSWTLGGTTRSGEFYKAYSAQNLINASKGTFEVTVNIPPYWKGGNNYAVFWEFLNTGGTDKLYLGSASGTNNLFVVINDSAGGTKTLTSENNVLTPGEHVISVTWNNTGNIGSIYLDGIPLTCTLNGSGTGIASTLNQIVIGSSNTFNTRVINANMSLISISNVERTDLNISDRTNAICPEVDSNIICIAPLVNSMNMYHIGGS